MRSRVWFLAAALVACEEDELSKVPGGALEVEIRNPQAETAELRVSATVNQGEPQTTQVAVQRPATFVLFEGLEAGSAEAVVTALTAQGAELDRVAVRGIVIRRDQTSRILVDFVRQPPPPNTPEEICNQLDDDNDQLIDEGVHVLCGVCHPDASVTAAADDDLCGEIPCDALNRYHLTGENTAAGYAECRAEQFGPLMGNRCAEIGRCRDPHDATVCGPPQEVLVASAGRCQLIQGCQDQTPPTLVTVPDGTPCGPQEICRGGACVPEVTPTNPVGCADGGREGFLDQNRYPNIAGCAGGWSIAGLRQTLAPACNRNSGDDSSNASGQGCNVADLCAPGWRVCEDKEDVAASSPTGCDGAVPPGTPNNGILFITRQRSTNNIICENRAQAMGSNDIFGCGNLATTLDASRNCAPLNRALASQHDGACDFNEAEPPLGPWVCGPNSLEESAHVVKNGSDKGGVLCCR